MSAKELGQKLLAEVEEVGLSEILNTLLLKDEFEGNRFGVAQLDAMVQCVADIRSTTSTLPLTSPIIELQSLYPGGGKSNLLYHLTAIAVLPTSLGGKQAAVVIVDTDGRFSVPRLAHQIRRQISLHQKEATTKPEIEEMMLLSLKHVHIFSPQSLSSTVATINSLPTYLFEANKHYSFDRTISFIGLDSASAFYWQHRTDTDDALLITSTSTSSRSIPQSNGYVQLAASLKNAIRTFNTSLIFTSWHHGYTKDSTSNLGPDAQSFRSSLPSPWPTLPTLRLIVQRAPVRKLPVEISVEDALGESDTRQKVVEKGKMECFVNEFGVEESVIQKLQVRGAGFDFYITEGGVDLDDQLGNG